MYIYVRVWDEVLTNHAPQAMTRSRVSSRRTACSPRTKSKCFCSELESLARLVSSLGGCVVVRRTLTTLQSTVLKQMKLIHHGGYNDQERDSYKEIIFSNTIQSMR
jgi:hypothetical protein